MKTTLFRKDYRKYCRNLVPNSGDFKQLFEYVDLGAQYVIRLNIKQLLPPVEMYDKTMQIEDELNDDDDEDNELNDAQDTEIKTP